MERRMTHRIWFIAIAVTGALAILAPAWAQPYPPGPGRQCTDPTVTLITPGTTIEICGSNWSPGTTVVITPGTGGPVVSSAPVESDGTFRAQVVVPADAEEEVAFEVAGTAEDGAPRAETVSYRVQSAALTDTAADGEGPARWLVIAAAALGAATIGGLVWTRRRSTVTEDV
jgi:hypothetical protein